jgi:hypothetical protein
MIQRICGIDTEVVNSDPSIWATSGMGRCEQKSAKILICAGLTPDVHNSTNVHEVVHMILDMNGFGEQTNNEQMVATLSNSLYAWMRDNRRMIQSWIEQWDKYVPPTGC